MASYVAGNTSEASVRQKDIFNIECLTIVNNYRRVHGVPHLCYSEKLAEKAQVWASKLAMEDKDLLHDPAILAAESSASVDWRRTDGENVGVTNPRINSYYEVLDVLSTWYSEIKDYNFDQHNESPRTSFFTQMIWASTRVAGFAKAKSKSGRTFIVARFRPTGNLVGEYQANVFPPIG
ncbi:hypothetical protein BOX15_Mlig009687g1 [Macrostomum lignano]|uniref:Uncharacterized protein n=2 Tax=Macrostomum lignano TaxID=282301 RepID=A0A267H146_9PLAT|nr:hypothetical protein BOX15_Mlig009687g1 [Macrostomum lignano]